MNDGNNHPILNGEEKIMKKQWIATTVLAMAGAVALGGCAPSDTDDSVDVDVEGLTGSEREQALYDAAQEEGEVVWYTGLIPEQIVKPIEVAFEEKYPGVDLKYFRDGSDAIAAKILTEARAGKPASDVWDGAHAAEALKAAGASEPYESPSLVGYPDDQRDPDGYWAAVNIYVKGVVYNTDMVDEADAPETYDDLLDPVFKGQMAWTPEATGGADYIGNVLATLGDDKARAYVEKLGEQDINVVQVSSRELLNQVVAGQYSVGIQVFNNHVALAVEQGAPVAFSPLTSASKQLNPLGLTAGAAHPNAARLLIDYLLSEEGQTVFDDDGYIPALPDARTDPALDPDSGEFNATLITPSDIEEGNADWVGLFDQANAG